MRAFLLAIGLLLVSGAIAEPYIAVREGLDCAACHVNPTGGGQRNAFGNSYGQTVLPAQQREMEPWTGQLAKYLAVGGNARFSARYAESASEDDFLRFDTDRVTLYVSASFADYFTLYIDEQIAPDGAINREAWGQFTFFDTFYIKAGKFFLPYGWRLEDDTAFTRAATGINFSGSDNGVEFGYLGKLLTAQLAVSNGTAGTDEIDDGKQATARLSLLRRNWQLGVSASLNNTDLGDRSMAGVFAGFNTGPLTWLAEWDYIEDDADDFELEQNAALLEANWLIVRGHNIKLTADGRFDESNDADEWRYSLVWEFFPLPFTQLRLGYRESRSDDEMLALGFDEYFIQLHGFF